METVPGKCRMIPVLWVSRHDNILARGYADQGLLEGIFDRSVWRPPAALDFEHHVVKDSFPDVEGAVVCLPCRHHASDDDVNWFISELDKLSWSVVILCGDEEWVFPWARIPETPTRKVWVMQPRPEHAHLSGLIPGGWYPDTFENIIDTERVHNWFFAGQVRDNARRQQCVRALKRLGGGLLHETEGYMQGWPKEEYFQKLSASKVVPSPSGPMTVDTARPLEAMEAGCVPVVDMVTPRNECYDYWSLVFGKKHPLPTVHDWRHFAREFRYIIQNWPSRSNEVFSFWQQWKRRITLQLDSDIKEVMQNTEHNRPLTSEGLEADDLITAIVTTSPVPLHPSTEHIEQTIESIRDCLPHAEIIICIDGIHPDQDHHKAAYEEYTRRLLWLCNFRWENVVPVVFKEWTHQALMTKKALEMVRTRNILFIEHDTPLEGDIDFDAVNLQLVFSNVVRFHFDVEIHPEHEKFFQRRKDVDFWPTFVWWQRPHAAWADFYRRMLDEYFTENSRTMLEDALYSVVSCDFIDHGWNAWDKWKIFTYAVDPSNLKHSGHLDSRQEDPKMPMVFR